VGGTLEYSWSVQGYSRCWSVQGYSRSCSVQGYSRLYQRAFATLSCQFGEAQCIHRRARPGVTPGPSNKKRCWCCFHALAELGVTGFYFLYKQAARVPPSPPGGALFSFFFRFDFLRVRDTEEGGV
jgi:hypothetical protein